MPSLIRNLTGDLDKIKQTAARTVRNILDYGADPTGTTDSLAAIQAALDAAAAGGGGTVEVPTGTYLLSNSIRVPSFVRLRGAGMDASVLKGTALPSSGWGLVVSYHAGGNGEPATGVDYGIEVQDLSVDLSLVPQVDYGNAGFDAIPQQGCNGISMHRSRRYKILRVRFIRCHYAIWNFSDGYVTSEDEWTADGLVQACEFIECHENIELLRAHSCRIMDNRIWLYPRVTSDGILLWVGSHNNVIQGNVITGTAIGINLVDGSHDNTIGSNAVFVDGVSSVALILSNMVQVNGANAAGYNNWVSGGVYYSRDNYAISLTESHESTGISDVVANGLGAGLYIALNATGGSISGGYFMGRGSGTTATYGILSESGNTGISIRGVTAVVSGVTDLNYAVGIGVNGSSNFSLVGNHVLKSRLSVGDSSLCSNNTLVDGWLWLHGSNNVGNGNRLAGTSAFTDYGTNNAVGTGGQLAGTVLPPPGSSAGQVLLVGSGGLATNANLTFDGVTLGLPVIVVLGQGDHGTPGTYAAAVGYAAKSGGYAAISLGTLASAAGDYSVAQGYNAQASQLGAFVLGTNSTANGVGATALGYITSAGNHYAMALGYNAAADLTGSMAIGGQAHAAHNYAVALGYQAVTTADHQVVLGTAAEDTIAPGGLVVGTGAIATTATRGYLWVPTCAGAPTGAPTNYTGRAPLVVDTSVTPPRVCFRVGGAWYYVALTAF